MSIFIVVERPKDWPLEIPGVEVVSARSYLTHNSYIGLKGVRVFNLCRSYRYQSLGYYVSLLAAARGHKHLPKISTIQDMKSLTMIRFADDDLEDLIQKSLAPLQSVKFSLSIYFGSNLAKRYTRLSAQLFNLFQAPLLRADFVHNKKWQLQNVSPFPASEIPEEHKDFAVNSATEFFSESTHWREKKPSQGRYDLAILQNPEERDPPSDKKALKNFVRAGERLGFSIDLIDKEDFGRLGEYDALFIRETTNVNHHTYRFARRAMAEGMVVIDDPESILKCTNKVYLAELMAHHKIPIPKTLILHRDNLDEVPREIGLPCIIKQPDSAFSRGVHKVDDIRALEEGVDRLLEKSEFVIAQEYMPTSFDWRVGVLDRQVLFVCKYHMSGHHWQIVKRASNGKTYYGKVESVPIGAAPRAVVATALKAANLIGDGLYGVDLKVIRRKPYVIEINDNPNIDSGTEDSIMGEYLYEQIMQVFLKRIEAQRGGKLK